MQIPDGPPNLICPLHRKSMNRVCRTCPLWFHIQGSDPNKPDVRIDRWDCSLAWLPTLLIDAAREASRGTAATQSFRNEMVSISMASMNGMARAPAPQPRPQAINREQRLMIEDAADQDPAG